MCYRLRVFRKKNIYIRQVTVIDNVIIGLKFFPGLANFGKHCPCTSHKICCIHCTYTWCSYSARSRHLSYVCLGIYMYIVIAKVCNLMKNEKREVANYLENANNLRKSFLYRWLFMGRRRCIWCISSAVCKYLVFYVKYV